MMLDEPTGAHGVNLVAEKIGFPCIVKPRVACGVDWSHELAIISSPHGFEHAEMGSTPLPAIVQEYVDHEPVVFKVYYAGGMTQVVRRTLTAVSEEPTVSLGCIRFHSLRQFPHYYKDRRSGSRKTKEPRVPIEEEEEDNDDDDVYGYTQPCACRVPSPRVKPCEDAFKGSRDSDLENVLKDIGVTLAALLGIRVLGFDAVVERGTGDVVIIDANYFPTFRGWAYAPEALQETVRQAINAT